MILAIDMFNQKFMINIIKELLIAFLIIFKLVIFIQNKRVIRIQKILIIRKKDFYVFFFQFNWTKNLIQFVLIIKFFASALNP